jgi:Na+-transporting NADH:ubiquinone oxidoreductase subunit NqrE
MKELLLIAIGSALVNNVVLSQFLGLCPFLGVSKKTETAAGMGGAVIFVITISSFITGLIYKFILANPFLVKKGIDLLLLTLPLPGQLKKLTVLPGESVLPAVNEIFSSPERERQRVCC